MHREQRSAASKIRSRQADEPRDQDAAGFPQPTVKTPNRPYYSGFGACRLRHGWDNDDSESLVEIEPGLGGLLQIGSRNRLQVGNGGADHVESTRIGLGTGEQRQPIFVGLLLALNVADPWPARALQFVDREGFGLEVVGD